MMPLDPKKLAKQYSYTVIDISKGDDIAYEAFVPKFPKMLIMADTVEDLHRVTLIAIEEQIEYLLDSGKTIPAVDRKKYSGKFMLRIEPDLHERLTMLAQGEGKSLNKKVEQLLKESVT